MKIKFKLRKKYITDLIYRGIKQNVVKFIENPNDGCIACEIGDYWFYFIGSEDENMTSSEVMESYTCDELIELIYGAMIELDDTEINYYLSYIRDSLNK